MARQGLCLPPHKPQSKADLQALIHRLGFVQMDSIRTVERAHHMVLFARNQNYRREHLRQLLEQDRHLFEHWTHDAALIPTEFYHHWRHRFALAEVHLRERWRKSRPTDSDGGRRIGFEDMMETVKRHVRQNGPTLARELKTKSSGQQKDANSWWQWHPSKTALEFLWRTGELSVSRREGFQKVYDLSARVIPKQVRQKAGQSKDGFIDWACNNALDRLAFATAGELAAYWGSVNAAEAKSWCAGNLGEDLIEVLVESADGSPAKPAFARPELLAETGNAAMPPGRLRVLSPFDPLVRDRKRLRRLFNFDYRIEIFVPEARRKYGYYVFPILEKDRMIGRIDMKARRDVETLHVTGLWHEPKVKPTRARSEGLIAELNRHAKFIGMKKVSYEPDYLKA